VLEEPRTGGGSLVGSVFGRCGSWRREGGEGHRVRVWRKVVRGCSRGGIGLGGAPGYRVERYINRSEGRE